MTVTLTCLKWLDDGPGDISGNRTCLVWPYEVEKWRSPLTSLNKWLKNWIHTPSNDCSFAIDVRFVRWQLKFDSSNCCRNGLWEGYNRYVVLLWSLFIQWPGGIKKCVFHFKINLMVDNLQMIFRWNQDESSNLALDFQSNPCQEASVLWFEGTLSFSPVLFPVCTTS